ncbi:MULTISPECIES: toll/interleukin-1 receptor domain-containing protein [unclassified Corallococcus]|uniref:toll/interleukin-1 receptor domain-containing protein n=1 Tax=unclassified Corallococcus TaxID=2685029 RepID=UPI001A8D3757|nr:MULTISPECIES: toll/interleukin-1 receptor domain-containing protein [unclassified Corallococcus]MBN9686117.1 toll/interleukin-1 receptor domain-containing protein [Corallococcus sp. NCSPR001]WAS82448.1 toll/interleukin-1 receptor domain-containing protein [Corallococcus sp. NCRR]
MSTTSPAVSNPEPVFISHSSADRGLVGFFVEQLLVAGIGLSPAQIFYTSAPSSPIQAGENFNPRIRQAIAGCRIVIALVSPNYYRSPFCMSELGVAWAAEKLLPILVPPVDFGSLEGVLYGMHCIRVGDKQKIFELYDRFSAADWHRPNRTGIFVSKVEDFLAGLPGCLSQLPAPDVVERSEYKKLEAQIDELSAKLKASAASAEELKKLARVPMPDAPQQKAPLATSGVSGGLLSPSTKFEKEDAEFKGLVAKFNQAAKSVPQVVMRMAYARAVGMGEGFRAFDSEAHEWQTAVKEGLVKFYEEDREWFLNFNSARVERVCGALSAVEDFWRKVGSGYKFDYEIKYRHIPSLSESAFSIQWFGFWWEEDPYEIPF